MHESINLLKRHQDRPRETERKGRTNTNETTKVKKTKKRTGEQETNPANTTRTTISQDKDGERLKQTNSSGVLQPKNKRAGPNFCLELRATRCWMKERNGADTKTSTRNKNNKNKNRNITVSDNKRNGQRDNQDRHKQHQDRIQAEGEELQSVSAEQKKRKKRKEITCAHQSQTNQKKTRYKKCTKQIHYRCLYRLQPR